MKNGIVVTTEHRGVFFGYVDGEVPNPIPAEITLTQARMCIFWTKSIRGVLGLASVGPNQECKISYAVPELQICKITAIIKCSPEAVANWEKDIWS